MSSESFPTVESAPNLKAQAIDAYKKFIDQGVTNPDNLDLEDPEVKAANSLYDSWQTKEDSLAKGDREKEHEANFAKTTFYVDAGFTDPSYLEDVVSCLDQDLQNAEEGGDKPLVEIAERIKMKMQEIEEMIEMK